MSYEFYDDNKNVIIPLAAGLGTFGAVYGVRKALPLIRKGSTKLQDKIIDRAMNPTEEDLRAFARGVEDAKRAHKEKKADTRHFTRKAVYGMNKSAADTKDFNYDFEPVDTLPAFGGAAAYWVNRKFVPLHALHAKAGITAAGIGGGILGSMALRQGSLKKDPLISDSDYSRIRSKDDFVRKTLPSIIRRKQLETEKFRYGPEAFNAKYLSDKNVGNFTDNTKNYYTLNNIKPKY